MDRIDGTARSVPKGDRQGRGPVGEREGRWEASTNTPHTA